MFRPHAVKSQMYKMNKKLFLSSCKEKNDYFYLSREGKIVARIFRLSGKWWIWYEAINTRLQVESFSKAIMQLEEEFK